MQSHLSTGSVQTAMASRLPSVELHSTEKMSLFEALARGGAIFRDNGIRICIQPVRLTEYHIMMIWGNGGLYEGVAPRLSKLYKFITELGVPFNTDWEVFRA